ncbi:MAG: hypothetical protein ACXVRJ_11900 [Gaiellaceae bacterium]
MNGLLDELVPVFEHPGDWGDVLRRAHVRRAPRRLVLVGAVAAAALVVGPALGVLLTRHPAPQLPAGADRKNVVVIVQPLTGRVLAQAAPWKGHSGMCYVLLAREAGCVPRTPHGAFVATRPVVGYTFDKRAVSGTAVTVTGKHVPLRLERFPKLHVTFFLRRSRLPEFFTKATLRDANGRIVASYALRH